MSVWDMKQSTSLSFLWKGALLSTEPQSEGSMSLLLLLLADLSQLLSFSEKSPQESILFFMLCWKSRHFRALGRICCVSKKKKKSRCQNCHNKNNTMFSLSTVLWSSLDHSLTRTPKGYVAGFQLLSLSSEKPRQAQP